jgi:RNA polymerase sigma-70 factor (ECF subfamily)
MATVIPDESGITTDLLRRVRGGDAQALAELFARHRDRLRRMVRLRLDRRLQGRVDSAAVLKEAFCDVCDQILEYLDRPALPLFLWLRSLTGKRLQDIHHRYLGGQSGNPGQEVSLYKGALPQASSAALAAQLLGRLTSATQAAARAAMQIRLQDALNAMDPLDREVLVLRHFEELNNHETAAVLGIDRSAASNRYLRALKRLKDILVAMPGFFSG